MSLIKSYFCCSNIYLHFSKHAVPLATRLMSAFITSSVEIRSVVANYKVKNCEIVNIAQILNLFKFQFSFLKIGFY